jgi:predicted nucleotidyltransferase
VGRKVIIFVQRVMLRTQGGPLRPVWAALYAVVTRTVAAYLCRGRRGAAAYVARSLALDDAVYGVSDIDLLVVIPGDPQRRGKERERLRRRWERLCRAVPILGEFLLPDVAFYEDAELREATAGSNLTYGLDHGPRAPAGRSAFRGPGASVDEFGLRARPGVCGPTRDWRLIQGPDRRPRVAVPDRQEQRIAAWQELQFWWSFAFGVAADPDRPRSASLCVKLIAEPARIWLSLVDGGEILRRRDVLRRALIRLPEEEEAIRRALDLHDTLGRRPTPPLAETLPAFVRLTSRVAERLREEMDGAGETPVRLTGGTGAQLMLPAADGPGRAAVNQPGEELLPLVDWRALAAPTLPDEAFRLIPGNPGDADDLGRAASAVLSGPYPALRADGLLILPALGVWDRAYMRAVQCQLTDPV